MESSDREKERERRREIDSNHRMKGNKILSTRRIENCVVEWTKVEANKPERNKSQTNQNK